MARVVWLAVPRELGAGRLRRLHTHLDPTLNPPQQTQQHHKCDATSRSRRSKRSMSRNTRRTRRQPSFNHSSPYHNNLPLNVFTDRSTNTSTCTRLCMTCMMCVHRVCVLLCLCLYDTIRVGAYASQQTAPKQAVYISTISTNYYMYSGPAHK